MKNKNVIITIIVVVILIAVGVGIYFLLNNKPSAPANINMSELNTNISKVGGFDEGASMQEVDKEMLANIYGITDTAAVESVIGKMPMINIRASMYVVIKAADGKVDYVKEKVDEYGKNYEQQWSTYLPDQHELVKARQSGNVGNYVYLIIAENAEELKGLIK